MRESETGERNIGASAGGSPPQRLSECVTGVFDNEQMVLVGNSTDDIPIGAVADQVRRHDRPGLRRNHLGNPIDVDLEGIWCDVDEHGNGTLANDGSNIGGEGHRTRDDFITRLKIDGFVGEIQRRTSGIAHHAALFFKEVGDTTFHGLDVLADTHGRRPTA
ncbi:unannotated protein [freshwater metagenome]|uniref:Unannotated protein n=1 Tax=freshwater metagenome TaxID=449393 RepID=A0A6J6Z0W5_9ZZZZ